MSPGMDESRDQPMADELEHEEQTRLPLSHDEQRALELYDRLRELQLEVAIINAQQAAGTGKLARHSHDVQLWAADLYYRWEG